MTRSSITFLSLAALMSCDPKSEDNASSDPIDDEEEEEDGPTVEGTIEYLSTGEAAADAVCDASIQFTGSNYTGDCETCDYSFMVNAELTDDRSGSDCEMLWQLSLLPVHDGQEDMLFGFTRSYQSYYQYYGYQDIATNVLWSGYVGYYDYGDTGGFDCSKGSKCQPMEDRWTPIAWDWSEEYAEYYQYYYQYYGYTPYNGGTATLVDGVISWTAYVNDGYNYAYAWFFDADMECEWDYDVVFGDMEVDDAPATGFIGDGTLPCPAYSWGGYDDYYDDYYGANGGSASDKAGLEWGVESPRGTTTAKSSSAAEPSESGWTWGAVADTASGLFTHMMTWASSSDEDTGWWDDEGDTGDWDDEYRENELVDVWTIDLSAGDEVLVTVDTLDDASGFDPGILVTGPDSCPLLGSDDSFNCTAGESDWDACPGVEFMADTDGTYHLIVRTVGCGETDEVTYQIGVDAPADPNLSLIEDDVLPYEIQTVRHEVTGTATITMPE